MILSPESELLEESSSVEEVALEANFPSAKRQSLSSFRCISFEINAAISDNSSENVWRHFLITQQLYPNKHPSSKRNLDRRVICPSSWCQVRGANTTFVRKEAPGSPAPSDGKVQRKNCPLTGSTRRGRLVVLRRVACRG